ARARCGGTARVDSPTDLRIRRRADARADQVVRRVDIRDPVADRLAGRLLQRARAEVDGADLGAEQLHPFDVGTLPPHVFLAHIDDAVEAEARTDRRRRDAVLPGAGLRDDALLAEAARQHGLAECVVQLVRARVEQVLAFQVEPLARCDPPGAGEGWGRARNRPSEPLEPGAKGRVAGSRAPARLELVERGHERLGHVTAAVRPERHRAAATNARTFSWSLIPGSVSSCDAASTAHGRTARTASRTLCGPSLPAPPRAAARCRCSGSGSSHGRSTTSATRSPSRSRTASRPRTRPSSRS